MINLELISDKLQNKNFVMFLTSIVFMFGILTFFYKCEILYASVITIILLILYYLKLFDLKKTLILIFVFYFGFFLTYFKVKTSDFLLESAPKNGEFTGRIVSIPESRQEDKTRFFMEVYNPKSNDILGKSLVTITSNNKNIKNLNIGDKVKLSGRMRAPFKSTNPSQFDYSAYLRNFNTFTVIYSEDIKILEENPELKWKFLQKLNHTRKKILNIHSKYLKSPNLEILGGIVFGDDAVSVPEYIKNSFVNSGLLHILAASGMNVGFIFSFWFYILRFLKIPYKPTVISGMGIIILYTLMTGLGPSVVRAALMLLFVLAGKLINRDTHSISLLAFVAVLMLIHNPADINDVSFQLSFLVTFGLITTASVISQKLEKIPKFLVVPVLIPLVAQIWVAPIQMFYFNTFSLYSIFANVLSAVLVSIISFCGFVSSILATIPKVADFVCATFDFYVNYLINLLISISDFFGNLPYCIIQTTHPNVIQIIVYYVMLLAITYLIKENKYKIAIITTICICSILLCSTVRFVSKDLEIIAFDVQNADSFLIKTPMNKYFFIDTGKAPYKSDNTQAKIIMLKYLKDRGIKNIEGIIVTHFDNDHSGGTPEFIEKTNVKTLYLNNTSKETQTAFKIFDTAEKFNQNIKIVKNNDLIYEEPNLKIKTFKANIEGKDKSNENSTVTLLSYKDFDVLFTADAGVESFNQIKSFIPHNIEILKVGHHGAFGVVDENMINHLNTKVSIVSTGLNHYGHPNKQTLDILRNTEILRTDLLNSVKISTDGSLYKIYSYNSEKKKYELRNEYEAK